MELLESHLFSESNSESRKALGTRLWEEEHQSVASTRGVHFSHKELVGCQEATGSPMNSAGSGYSGSEMLRKTSTVLQ